MRHITPYPLHGNLIFESSIDIDNSIQDIKDVFQDIIDEYNISFKEYEYRGSISGRIGDASYSISKKENDWSGYIGHPFISQLTLDFNFINSKIMEEIDLTLPRLIAMGYRIRHDTNNGSHEWDNRLVFYIDCSNV